MATVFFNLSTRPFSSTNDITVKLYKTTDPLAAVATQTDTTVPHVAKTWSFPGLDKTNYICKILETTGGSTIQVLDEFTFVPDNNDVDYKPPQLIQFGVTEIPGDEPNIFPAGVNNVVVPDWIGWDVIIERIGSGTMKEGVDYSYIPETGYWQLLQDGDIFGNEEYFFVQFQIKVSEGGGTPEPPVVFSFRDRLLVTVTTTLTVEDIGKKILVRAASAYLEITLPDIALVAENVVTYFEFCQGNLKCCKIKTASGQVIDWLKRNGTDRSFLHGCPNETIELYKEHVDEDTDYWRVHSSDGNFRSVGQRVAEDQIAADVVNKLLLDGGGAGGVLATEYARLYEDYVLNLPASQVVAFSLWTTGNNKYKYSYKDTGTNRYHIPDLRDMFMRMTDGTRKAGDFMDHAMQDHRHLTVKFNTGNNTGNPAANKTINSSKDNGQTNAYILSAQAIAADAGLSSGMVDDDGDAIIDNIDDETRPVNVTENYYVLV